MPIRAPRICGCGKVIAFDVKCACEMRRDAESKARFDEKRPSCRERGYTTKWDIARKDFLAAHPTCVRCGAPASVVNHKIPHRGDMKLFWNRSNWESACKPCHDGPIQSQEKRRPDQRNGRS